MNEIKLSLNQRIAQKEKNKHAPNKKICLNKNVR